MNETINVTKTYSTRGAKRKLMGDALKASKSTIIKIKRLRKGVVLD